MLCPICAGALSPSFTAQVLGRYLAQYEVCDECGFLRVREPYWLEEAYARAIAALDTGLVSRNVDLAGKIASVLYWVLGERGNGHYLDVAGGFGLLTRLMRDSGFDFYWDDKFCENLLAPGFEFEPSLRPCRAVTAVEVLEHLTDPIAFFEETLSSSGADTVLFTTALYDGGVPTPDSWWYYAFDTGQHIGFFKQETLEIIAGRLGLAFCTANGLHAFSAVPINETVYRLVTSRWATPAAHAWIRRRLGSRTMRDHLEGIARQHPGDGEQSITEN